MLMRRRRPPNQSRSVHFSSSPSSSSSSRINIRLVSINDVYEIDKNLPKLQTFLTQLTPKPDAVLLCGDFLSPSTLSSIDCGRGMVATLRTVGITHVSLGNHEQDLQFDSLRQRLIDLSAPLLTGSQQQQQPSQPQPLIQIVNSNMQHNLPSQAQWMSTVTQPYSIVKSRCGNVKLALIGLLSDEPGIFPDDTFKSVPIQNVVESYQERYNELLLPETNNNNNNKNVSTSKADWIVPMTHQSMARDKELARYMLSLHKSNNFCGGPALILGGHEHEPYHEVVTTPNGQDDNDDPTSMVHIFKSGMDANAARVIDLTFEVETTTTKSTSTTTTTTKVSTRPKLIDVQNELVELKQFEPSPIAQQVVNKHMSVIQSLDQEVIVDVNAIIPILPTEFVLSSKRTRYRQTTVGSILCQMIKEQYEGHCDVAMINGATIKGDATYPNNTISYADLKKELPFPTKMVLVPISCRDLYDAIIYSRTNIEEGTDTTLSHPPRRGYLQLDYEMADGRWEDLALRNDDELRVALPRNLLNGFCKIRPLMDVGKRLKEHGIFPGPDDFVPAIDVIVRHSCKNRWYQLVGDKPFTYFDLNDDGVLDRDEVQAMLTELLGYKPMDFVVDDMIASIDRDGNGVIDQGEFSFVLAQIERDHGRFWGG
ncbi:calcineurin-like phosphoesterase [Nitzschia inconspicua]|uniref:Calcineurin-like phosphoesterase n=1 Tax=Nitzschia inconspicua TaxID=303405 RepID=A0A9K3K5R2_9STRA|nr:calcineurin-like phosphoesterase [Nitzschia inconspicua]KAG7358062.1 calcineurin-like phosphoesterase [Nitzschia inconspicua]